MSELWVSVSLCAWARECGCINMSCACLDVYMCSCVYACVGVMVDGGLVCICICEYT